MSDTTDKWKELQRPFPKESIGHLPKAGVTLDFVGHAAVTDRLLSVDPEWTWEPLALDATGLPAYDEQGGLWIKLTVLGVTRLGYGDGPNPKERIGDALRNAAMRFGVALDLWTKGELESHVDETLDKPPAPTTSTQMSPADAAELVAMAKSKGAATKEDANGFLNQVALTDDWTTLPASKVPELKKAVLGTIYQDYLAAKLAFGEKS